MIWVVLFETCVIVVLTIGFLALDLECDRLRAGKLFDEAQIERLKVQLGEALVKAAEAKNARTRALGGRVHGSE
jgi:hypothetical protein